MHLTKSRIQIAATLLVACLLPMVAASAPIRVAVLNVGVGAGDVAAFSELIETALAGKDGIELLDRKTVDRLLQEHELILQNADQEAERAIQTGKLLAVDLFLLLEKVGEVNRAPQIRIRVLDTRYGLKLADYAIQIPSTGALETCVAAIAARTASLARETRLDPDAMLLVAVSGFRSIQSVLELETKTVSSILGAHVENLLVHHPGVILLERNRLTPLVSERELVALLPEALHASAVLVDGELEQHETTGDVSLTVRLSRAGKAVQVFEIDGNVDDLHALARLVDQEISERLGRTEYEHAFDANAEADLLFAQASLERIPERRVALVEAALALVPDDPRYQLRYLEYVTDYRFRGNTFIRERTRSVFESLMAFERADSWLTKRRLGGDVLCRAAYLLKEPFRQPWRGTAGQHLGRVNRDIWTAMQTVRKQNVNQYASMLLSVGFVQSAWDMPRAEDACSMLKELCTEARHYKCGLMGEVLLNIAHLPYYQAEIDTATPEKIKLLLAMYEELSTSADAGLAFIGKWGQLQLAVKGYNKLTVAEIRRRYEQIEACYLGKGSPEYETCIDVQWLLRLLDRGRFYDDDEADELYRLKGHVRIAEHLLNQRNAEVYFFAMTPRCVQLLEKAGRPAEAVALFRRIIEQAKDFKNGKWCPYLEKELEAILARNPQLTLAPDEPEKQEYVCKSLVSSRDEALFRNAITVILDHEVLAVICQNGVLRLNPETLKVQRFQRIPTEAQRLSGQAVAEGTTIYAACSKGILILPESGKPTMMRLRKEIPGDAYMNYDVLHGKLYTILGGDTPQQGGGLAEVDPKTGKSRILVSNRSELRGIGIRGDNISGAVADRVNGRILFKASGGPDGGRYAFTPEDGTLSSTDVGLKARWRNTRRYKDELAFHCASAQLVFFRIADSQIVARIQARKGYGALSANSDNSFACRIGQGALVFPGASREPMYYPPGDGAPQKIGPMLFPHRPDPPQILDAVMHERGLLVLTPEGLYLSEGMLRLHHGNENRL